MNIFYNISKSLKYTVGVSLLFMLATSCTDDKFYEEQSSLNGPEYTEDGEPLAIMVENSEIRTRDVDFEENAPVRINTVWLGVFDNNTGYCVSRYESNSGYAFLSTGEKAYGIVRHKLPEPKAPSGEALSGEYFMIAIVNYKDVLGYWNNSTSETRSLAEMLAQVENWNQFNSIGIDTNTAYNGDHATDAPMMVGFLNGSTYNPLKPSASHIKVNQWDTENPVALTMDQDSRDNFNLRYNNGWVTTDKTLLLRRLVSNITFNISVGEDYANDIAITSLLYKRHYEPKAVYIVERTMLDSEGKFPTQPQYSPNFAALDPVNLYTTDQYFSPRDQDPITGKWTINYQHFANKHWARTEPATYQDREDYTKDAMGNMVFTALADNASDMNNYASFIELKMRILDKNRNRCADVTYFIHEGFTSNHDGSLKENDGETDVLYNTKLKDFSCARNRNYTYNIIVNGFDNLSVNAGRDDKFLNQNAKDLKHHPDQCGTVWTIKYVGEDYDEETGKSDFGYNYGSTFDTYEGFDKYLTGAGNDADKLYTTYSEAIKFANDNPYLGFRIYGYDTSQNKLQGYNFQFEEDSFDYLRGMWPPSVGNISHYYHSYDDLIIDFYKPKNREQLKNDREQLENYRKELESKFYMENQEELQELITYMAGEESSINTHLFETFMFKVSDNETGDFKISNIEDKPNWRPFTINGKLQDGTPKTWTVGIAIDIDMSQPMNIEQFMRAMRHLMDNNKTIPKTFDVMVAARKKDLLDKALLEDENLKGKRLEEAEKDLVRCLYIGDRSGHPDVTDGCTKAVDVFAVIQGVQGIQ